MHPNAYPTFPSGSTVMALYPDTSCFYRAEVISTPKELAKTASKDIKARRFLSYSMNSSTHFHFQGGKQQLAYVLKFEDDDDQEHAVAAQWVVEWPGA
jgi:SAGA-associated factor 29